MNSSTLLYSICNHEWSFLEGEKRHSHTLKAGRHLFPFQLQIGGSMPSSMYTTAHGGASISYKLRAVAVRPGLAHNLQAVAPVSILRSFSSEALEYQQTLEIENSWPEKLMYSIMLPHKAWAIGDKITTLAKFSPLAKGTRVTTVSAAIHETTKLHTRSGYQEHKRVVAHAEYKIVGHKAVCLEEPQHGVRTSHFQPTHSGPTTPGLSSDQRNTSSSSVGSFFARQVPSGESTLPTPSISAAGPSAAVAESDFSEDQLEDTQLNTDDVVTNLKINIPLNTVATHTLEPIIVMHRIRWSILIENPDGHTSELRCSLPLHILDHRLLQESQAHTAVTRQLLLGGPEISDEARDEQELPSYRAHVYDRVANMFLPDSATRRVRNPWVSQGSSPVMIRNSFLGSTDASGASSPLTAHPLSSHLPREPGLSSSTPLEWVNSELLLSLSDGDLVSTPPDDHPSTSEHSRPGSRPESRRQSRAPSPDHHHHRSAHTPPSPVETFVHGSHASRNVHGVFQASMKPLSSNNWLPSRSNSHSNLSSQIFNNTEPQQTQTPSRPSFPNMHSQSASELLHRAFTEVPDYGMASRGFIGGVPPLTSMRGLPSYDEAEQSHGDTNVAARFEQALGRDSQQPQSLTSSPGL
jgi:hypothetical protein